MNVTASMALKLIQDSLRAQPIFLCIDDTMVSKFGKKFEDGQIHTCYDIRDSPVLSDYYGIVSVTLKPPYSL